MDMALNGILWLLAGALIGVATSFLMRPDASRDIVFNMWVAIVGAALGGWLLGPLIDAPGRSRGFDIAGLLMSLLGAMIMLASMSLVRRGLSRI